MNIDWELFQVQKTGLISLATDPRMWQEDIDVLDGVINLMDAIQDEFQPLDIDESDEESL